MHKRVSKDKVPYDRWERDGFLQATEGDIIYYDFIESKISELGEQFNRPVRELKK